jgi:hypothetical protein
MVRHKEVLRRALGGVCVMHRRLRVLRSYVRALARRFVRDDGVARHGHEGPWMKGHEGQALTSCTLVHPSSSLGSKLLSAF